MRILFSLDKYRNSEGGADKLAKGVVSALLAGGHEVCVLEAGALESRQHDGALTLVTRLMKRPRFIRDNDIMTLRWNVLWDDFVTEEIDLFRPDLLITQNMLAPVSVAAAKRNGIRSMILFHGYRPLDPTFFRGRDALTCEKPGFGNLPFKYKIKWIFTGKTLELYNAAYRAADCVVANSGYIAKVIERYFERKAEVFYPIIDLESVGDGIAPLAENPILFVKPQAIKGIDKVLQIARLMPERRFVIAGSASRRTVARIAALGNMEYRGWVDDMDALYRESSLLLGPAQIPEPFGRIFIEAGLRGLPSVASDAGGIPESVGSGGRLVGMDAPAEEWRTAIEQSLLSDSYPALSQNAFEYASDLAGSYSSEMFCALVKSMEPEGL